jgi:hypothetical protein
MLLCFLLQLPRKLGLLASTKLVLDPCATDDLLPTFLDSLHKLLSAVQRDCVPQVQAEVLQQLVSSGLFKAFHELKEATAQQLEQGAAAAGGDELALRQLRTNTTVLFCIQVY